MTHAPLRRRLVRPRLLLAVAGASVVAFALTGSSFASPAAKSGGNFGMVTATTTQNAMIEMALGGKGAAAALHVHLTEAAPTGANTTVQIQQFQAMTQTAKNGIALEMFDANSFIRPMAQAVSAGVPVVSVDTAPLPPSKVTTYVGNSNTELGEIVGRALLKKIPPGTKGQVVMGNDIPGLPLLGQRLDGMKAVLSKARPGLTFLGPYNVGSEPTDNYNHWSAVVRAHPNAVAYLAPGDQDAVSFYKLSKQNNKHYLVAACDLDPTALLAIKQGYVYALGDPRHWMKGYIAITLLVDSYRTGKPMPKGWINSGSGLVTQANIDQIIARQKNNTTRAAFFTPIAKQLLAHLSQHIKPISEAN